MNNLSSLLNQQVSECFNSTAVHCKVRNNGWKVIKFINERCYNELFSSRWRLVSELRGMDVGKKGWQAEMEEMIFVEKGF